MNLIELKGDIVKNNIKHFYIFVGEEIGIMNIYLAEMSNKLSLSLNRIDNVGGVYDQVGDDLFGGGEKFFVVRNDKDFAKSDSIEHIEEDLGKSYLVLLYDKLDARSKMSKQFEDRIVKFETLSQSVLVSYITKNCPLSYDNAVELSECVGGSYDCAMLECDKINHYANESGKDVNYTFKLFRNEGMIMSKNQAGVFDFTHYVMGRQFGVALHIAQELMDNGVDAVTLLGTLYSSMKSTLLVQICESDDVSAVTGLDKGKAYYAGKYCGRYSDEKLVGGVKLISQVVSDIKDGLIDMCYAIPYVLVSLY